jgi:hypothetical protein
MGRYDGFMIEIFCITSEQLPSNKKTTTVRLYSYRDDRVIQHNANIKPIKKHHSIFHKHNWSLVELFDFCPFLSVFIIISS